MQPSHPTRTPIFGRYLTLLLAGRERNRFTGSGTLTFTVDASRSIAGAGGVQFPDAIVARDLTEQRRDSGQQLEPKRLGSK